MSEHVKPLAQKILESGLIDAATALQMVHWGFLPEGSDKVAETKSKELANAPREKLVALADSIAEEVEKDRKLRETMLDLNQLRWPTKVRITPAVGVEVAFNPARTFYAMIDRMGRLYFRPADVKKAWLQPGFILTRENADDPLAGPALRSETILEVTELYTGDEVAAIQVSTRAQ